MKTAIDIKPTDKYIPWLVVLFFLTFMTVDAFMVTVAIRTQTGLVTENAYEKGLAYNQTIAAARQQETLGWSNEISIKNNRLIFLLSDTSGLPISGAQVKAKIIREVQAGYDLEIPLVETSRHSYEADIKFPMPGEWTIRVFSIARDHPYQVSSKIMAP